MMTRGETIDLLAEALRASRTPSSVSERTGSEPVVTEGVEGRLFEQFRKLNPPLFS